MTLTEQHDFEANLVEANQWETKLEEVIENVVWSEIENIEFEHDPEAQLNGLDYRLVNKEFSGLQLKVRDYTYYANYDLFLETTSIVETNTPGWIYTYDNIVVAYCWKNKAGNNLKDGVLLLVNDDFRLWFNGVKDGYMEKQTASVRGGETWHTEGTIIPVEDIPKGFIRERFDPTLPTNITTQQRELDSY